MASTPRKTPVKRSADVVTLDATPSHIPIEDDDPEDDDPGELAVGERIAAALSQANENVKCSLHKVETKTGKMPWCCDYTSDEFMAGGLEMVRASWGPGDYELRLTGARGMIKGGRPRFTIAAPLLGMGVQQPNAQAAQAASETSQLMRMLVEGQQAMLAKLNAPPPPAPPPPPRMTPTEIAGIVSAGIGIVRALKDVFGAGKQAASDPVAQITQLLGAVREVRKATDELKGDGEDEKETSMLDLAKQGIALVGTAMQNRNQLPAVNTPPSLAAPPLPPAPPNEATTDTPEEDNPMFKALVSGIVQKLMASADANEDPAVSADFMINHPLIGQQAVMLLELPNWLEVLTLHPMFQPHAADFRQREAWFARMRAEAVRMISEGGES